MSGLHFPLKFQVAKLSIRVVVVHECGIESMFNKTLDGQFVVLF